MPGAFVQVARNVSGAAFVNISPIAGHLLVLDSQTSAGGGNPTVTSVQAMSGAGGTGTVLATFTIPTALATSNVDGGFNIFSTGAYLQSCPAGIASILVTYNGGTPGSCDLQVSEHSGLATSSPLIAVARQYQAEPGTGVGAISSGLAVITAIPAYLLGSRYNLDADTDAAAADGFTLEGTVTNQWALEDRRETTATGNYAATFTAATHGATDAYTTTLFAFAEQPPPAALAGTLSDTTSGSGTLTNLEPPGWMSLAQWNTGGFLHRRIISQPTVILARGWSGGRPAGTPVDIFPLLVGTGGSFTITDNGVAVLSIAATDIVQGVPIRVGITCMHDITISEVPAGGQYGISWEGGEFGG